MQLPVAHHSDCNTLALLVIERMATIKVSIQRRASKKWNSVSNLLEAGPYAPSEGVSLKKKKTHTTSIQRKFSLKKYTEKEAKLRVQLFQAAGMGNATAVEQLLDSGSVDVNVTDYDFITALHRAAKYCQVETLLALLARGADPNATDMKNGLTPLHWLIIHSDPKFHSAEFEQCLVALVAAGADLNKGDFNGVTPLHCAVTLNYTACVRLLLQLGSKPYLADHLGSSPMVTATDKMYSYMKTQIKKESETDKKLSERRKSIDMW